MKAEYRAYCNLCAFNCTHNNGCIALNKRIIPCWSKCTKEQELNERYKEMLSYSIDAEVRSKIKKEYKRCLENFSKQKIKRGK